MFAAGPSPACPTFRLGLWGRGRGGRAPRAPFRLGFGRRGPGLSPRVGRVPVGALGGAGRAHVPDVPVGLWGARAEPRVPAFRWGFGGAGRPRVSTSGFRLWGWSRGSGPCAPRFGRGAVGTVRGWVGSDFSLVLLPVECSVAGGGVGVFGGSLRCARWWGLGARPGRVATAFTSERHFRVSGNRWLRGRRCRGSLLVGMGSCGRMRTIRIIGIGCARRSGSLRRRRLCGSGSRALCRRGRGDGDRCGGDRGRGAE